MFKVLKKYLGVVVFVSVALYAFIQVAYNHITYHAPDVTTIRVCHWQLETGFREALSELIKEYEELYYKENGTKIRIVQQPISEKGYLQAVNCALIGNMAPDLMEIGAGKTPTDPFFLTRFFVPLGEYVIKDNPHNKDTDLEGIAWNDTFFDGLYGCFEKKLYDYYTIPMSMFTFRIYYNKNLLEKITGTKEPPEEYQEFISACAKIREYSGKQGETFVPVAGTKSQLNWIRRKYEAPFLLELTRENDLNSDGLADRYETYYTYRKKKWDFNSPAFIASWKCLSELAGTFQKGWQAASRDDALFLFVQQKAVMYATGSWDAQSVVAQTSKDFEVGAFAFPVPKDHPEYRKFVKGPVSEAAIEGGIRFGITRDSENIDVCIDFLQFCSTRKNNQRFNDKIMWMPVVRGAKVNTFMEPFKPRVEGFHMPFIGKYQIFFEWRNHVQHKIKGDGEAWSLFSGKMSAEEYSEIIQNLYNKTALDGYELSLERQPRGFHNLNRVLGGRMARTMCRDEAPPEELLSPRNQELVYAIQEFNHSYEMNKLMYNDLEEKENF
ncbi:ABC transporter substrate-binding protein [Verrucomicrobiota bacterium]